MSESDFFEIQARIINNLKKEQTILGIFKILNDSFFESLSLNSVKVFEFIQKDKHLNLIACNLSDDQDKKPIVKKERFLITSSPFKPVYESHTTQESIENGLSIVRIPMCSMNNCIAVVETSRTSPLSPTEKNFIEALCAFGVYMIEGLIEKESLVTTQKKLESILSEHTVNLDIALDKISDQFTELKLYKTKTEVLIKETYHRVNNNLQIILSIIHLYESYTDEGLTQLKEISSRVRILSSIHLNMVNSIESQSLNLGNFLQDILSQLNYIYNNVKSDFVNNSTKIGLDFDTSLPLGLMIYEVVSYLKKSSNNEDLMCSFYLYDGDAPNEIILTVKCSSDLKIVLNKNGEQPNIHLALIDALIDQLEAKIIETSDRTSNISISFTLAK